MPIMELLNDACNCNDSGQLADIIANAILGRGNPVPGFYLFRTVWVDPSTITEAVAALRHRHPELNLQVVAPQSFFSLFKESQETQGKTARQ
jgi:hypothetical protein